MNKTYKIYIFLSVIFLLSFRLIYIFSSRTSYYCDEVYTYGISNSIGNPILVWTGEYENNTDDEFYHSYREQWYDGSILHNYLTINSDEKFHFSDVIINKSWDNAPPNYELLVHFICSFFPESFSWSYAFCVNFLFYVASLIVVFGISVNTIKKTSSKFTNAIICTIFWGLSICGTGAFTFLRMYGVLCFYSLLMIYSIQRILDSSTHNAINYVFLSVSFMCGIFTHTLFIVFAFWITLFTCLYLLIKKQIKNVIITGSTVLFSLVIFLLLFNFDRTKISSWMSNQNSDGYSFSTNLSFANKYTFSQSIGIYIPFTYVNILIFFATLLLVSFVIALICILFRKEKWFNSLKDKIITPLKNIAVYIYDSLKELSPIVIIMFLSSIGYMILIAAISPIVSQGIYSIRYLLLCMNAIVICFISLVHSLFRFNSKRTKIIFRSLEIIVLSGLLLMQNYIIQNPLTFTNLDDNEKLHELVSDKDVAVFASRNPLLNEMIIPLRDTDHFYFDKILSDKDYNFTTPQSDFFIAIDESIFNNTAVSYNNYIPGVETSSDFISYILKDKSDDYTVTLIDDYLICRREYSVFYLVPKN